MASSTNKKVIIRRFDREPLSGFVSPGKFQLPHGVEFLTLSGAVSVVPYSDIKLLSFVKTFDAKEEPNRLVFSTRPKVQGLWVRLTFRDGEVREGMLPNDLLHGEAYGFLLTPAMAGNEQRIFVPRASLNELAVISVIGNSQRKSRPIAPASSSLDEQLEMFPATPPTS